MSSEKIKLIAITGPTASGKSALAEKLADRFSGEIVSCDSMQIYRSLDIGTAKPTKQDREKTVYHMIDIVDPCDSFSCSDYADMAQTIIREIYDRKKTPILCGGTGLYFDSVINPTSFSAAQCDESFRASLEGLSNSEIYQMLREIDGQSAEKSHENNRKRNIRALEIYNSTGITKSRWDEMSRQSESPYDLAHITLVSCDRSVLYQRINDRVDAMISGGIIDEVKAIDFPNCSSAAQAIGYKEFFAYLNGSKSLRQSVDDVKQATRNYAKRQLTWFSRYKDALKLDISDSEVISNNGLFSLAESYIKEKLFLQ